MAQYAAQMPVILARALSILGHPLVVLSMAALLLAADRGTDARRLSGLLLGLLALGGLVMAYSWWQVRRERWTHIDASGKTERRSLNRFLLVALLLAAISARLLMSPPELASGLAWGLASSALLVAVAMATARWWKLSLHVAFAVFAAILLSRLSWFACAGGLSFAAALAWSRLALSRHTPRDLLAGAAAGALVGTIFLQLAPVAD